MDHSYEGGAPSPKATPKPLLQHPETLRTNFGSDAASWMMLSIVPDRDNALVILIRRKKNQHQTETFFRFMVLLLPLLLLSSCCCCCCSCFVGYNSLDVEQASRFSFLILICGSVPTGCNQKVYYTDCPMYMKYVLSGHSKLIQFCARKRSINERFFLRLL